MFLFCVYFAVCICMYAWKKPMLFSVPNGGNYKWPKTSILFHCSFSRHIMQAIEVDISYSTFHFFQLKHRKLLNEVLNSIKFWPPNKLSPVNGASSELRFKYPFFYPFLHLCQKKNHSSTLIWVCLNACLRACVLCLLAYSVNLTCLPA